MKREFSMGFLGRRPFNEEKIKAFQEKWSKMTDSEKLEFANAKVEKMGRDPFSVEAIDAKVEKWMGMSAEEKQEFVDKRKKAFKKHCKEHGHGHHGHHGRRHRHGHDCNHDHSEE